MADRAEFHFSPRPNRAGEISWRNWGPEAFAEATAAEKPVLLAISAVWCHWCHVMDETSYSDGEVIRLINERFVPIRVDNDQRPDVNRRYNMGGWPTTAFLSPGGEILHGGTYLPPDQMRHLLEHIAQLWREKRDELTLRIAEMRERQRTAQAPLPGDLSPAIVDAIGALIRGQYDPEQGGFGREPKFPQPHLLRFLVDEHFRGVDESAGAMVRRTLAAMAGGGMYDAVEGGFFRYSTTRDWSVPHFEKMLEDNSQLLALCADAHRAFPEDGFDRIVRDVIRYMDTVLWRADVQAFSGSQDADERYFALPLAGRLAHGAPYVDRTVYTSWNALAASGYLAAARAFNDASLAARAVAVLRSLLARMRGADGTIYRYDRGAGPAVGDLLVDRAALIGALLDAHEAAAMPEALDEAVAVAVGMRDRLEDPAGGFFDMPGRDEPGRLSIREKPIEDGSLAAAALLRLAALTQDETWRASAIAALRGFVSEYTQWGQFAASYGTAVVRALAEPVTIAIVGVVGDRLADDLWRIARRSQDPAASSERLDPARDSARLAALGYPADRVAAYVCVGTVCSAPLTTPDALGSELSRRLRAIA